VLDIAGGSGHLALALALRGVHATVIDVRREVGWLPKRDRKALGRALREQGQQQEADLQGGGSPKEGTSGEAVRVRPFGTLRAWFGGRPPGADSVFGGGEDALTIPSCGIIDGGGRGDADGDTSRAGPTSCTELLATATAVCALHPDEATEAAVDWAVHHRRPFVVVPCCVFTRLFPHRRLASGMEVTTRAQLVEYLCQKHPAIQQARLPFAGANVAVWCAHYGDSGQPRSESPSDGGVRVGVNTAANEINAELR